MLSLKYQNSLLNTGTGLLKLNPEYCVWMFKIWSWIAGKNFSTLSWTFWRAGNLNIKFLGMKPYLYWTMWSRYHNVVVGGHVFEMGNRWGKGKREWGAKGGGGQYTADQGSEWMGIAPRQRRDFQVRKRGAQGLGEGFPSKGGFTEGLGSAPSMSR